MKFIRGDQTEVANAVYKRLAAELNADKRALWLVSGGSNVEIEVKTMDLLRDNLTDTLHNLTILPMDERYGAPGHENSNTEYMRRSGFVQGSAEWIDILTHDVSFDETIQFYDDIFSEAAAVAGIVIGQFGFGTDGHVAGILPGSPACEEDYATVVGYEWDDYVRLTLSPRALSAVSVAYVPAYGSSKVAALQRLQRNEGPLEKLPGRLLYEIPEVYVYTDNDIPPGTH